VGLCEIRSPLPIVDRKPSRPVRASPVGSRAPGAWCEVPLAHPGEQPAEFGLALGPLVFPSFPPREVGEKLPSDQSGNAHLFSPSSLAHCDGQLERNGYVKSGTHMGAE
jgi:hypothetical protein